jgi:hypothetical protein
MYTLQVSEGPTQFIMLVVVFEYIYLGKIRSKALRHREIKNLMLNMYLTVSSISELD